MLRRILGVLAIVIPALAGAQGTPGTNVSADIVVDSMVRVGDTTRVFFQVANKATSLEQLSVFSVPAPRGAIMSMPQPQEEWYLWNRDGTAYAAQWWSLGTAWQPGGPPVQLSLSASAIPVIAQSRLRGFVMPREMTEADSIERNACCTNNTPKTQWAFGLVARPTSQYLLEFQYNPRWACDYGLISSASLCTSLRAKADSAFAAHAAGDLVASRAWVDQFRAQLDSAYSTAPSSGVVSSVAYWVLRVLGEVARP